jgi:hypothetical protein
VLHDGAERWAMQVIEVGVRHQHQIDRGQISDAQPGTPQPFQNKEPAGKVGIDDDAASAKLQEKASMPDEGDAQFSIGDQAWLVSLAAAWSYCGVPHQPAELGCALTKGRIAKRLLDHPAASRGRTGTKASASQNTSLDGRIPCNNKSDAATAFNQLFILDEWFIHRAAFSFQG